MSARRTLVYLFSGLAIALAVGCGGKSKSSSSESGVTITSASASSSPASAAPSSGAASGASSSSASSAPSGSGAASGSSSSASSAPSGGGAASGSSEVQAFGAALAKVKSFRATISSTGGAQAADGTMEVSIPDRFHFTSGNLEIISIGNDSYLKVNGTWIKSPSGGAGSIFQPTQISSLAATAQTGQATKGGTDTVNGKKCQVYTTTSSGSTQDVCIADNLPLRIVTTSGTSKTTIVFTDFDKPVDIKAPI